MQKLTKFHSVFDQLKSLPRRRVAVACPHDSHTLQAIFGALEDGLADFVLVGRTDLASVMHLAARFAGRVELVVEEDPDQAARRAVALVREGNADVLMKGMLNTDNLLRAVLNKQEGILAPGAVLTHVTGAEIVGIDRLLFFSDAAVIPYPTAEQHSAIVGYLADVCHAFGIADPKVALIHCTEKTSEKFPVTIGYAAIKERAAAGTYGAVTVDGPIDVKCALNAHAAEIKGIVSPVAGEADALVFPDIEAGNVFYKAISLFAQSTNAGMLMGAQAPVVLPSRGDSSRSKLCSIAMACLYASAKA